MLDKGTRFKDIVQSYGDFMKRDYLSFPASTNHPISDRLVSIHLLGLRQVLLFSLILWTKCTLYCRHSIAL